MPDLIEIRLLVGENSSQVITLRRLKTICLASKGTESVMVTTDAYSGLKSAYPMPDKSAKSSMMAIKHFKGDRGISRFHSDRSGEIERALRQLHIVSDTSQPRVPQTNAVAERLVQDVLEETRTALFRAGLPPCFWEFACQHYCMMETVLPRRKSGSPDGGVLVLGNLVMENRFYGKLIPL